jgi:hypothetical protein
MRGGCLSGDPRIARADQMVTGNTEFHTSRGDGVIIHEQRRRAYDPEEPRRSSDGPYYKDERKEDGHSKDKASSYKR